MLIEMATGCLVKVTQRNEQNEEAIYCLISPANFKSAKRSINQMKFETKDI